MRKTLIFIIPLLITTNLFSQNYLRGVLVDIRNKQPIPYCNVYIKNRVGTTTNQKGQFLLDIRAVKDKDSLTISNILYHKKQIPMVALLKEAWSDTLFLSPKVYILPQVNVRKGNCRVVERGVKRRRFLSNRHITIRPSKVGASKVAVFIENNFPKWKNVQLKSVKYNILDKSKTGHLFRVHVYAVDKNRFIPGKELLLDNVIEKFPMTDGWVEVDLSTYNIKMPSKGIFIAIEFLDYYVPKVEELMSMGKMQRKAITKAQFRAYRKEMANIKREDVWLLLKKTEYKHRKLLTWFYNINGWRRDLPYDKKSLVDNACIAAKFCIY